MEDVDQEPQPKIIEDSLLALGDRLYKDVDWSDAYRNEEVFRDFVQLEDGRTLKLVIHLYWTGDGADFEITVLKPGGGNEDKAYEIHWGIVTTNKYVHRTYFADYDPESTERYNPTAKGYEIDEAHLATATDFVDQYFAAVQRAADEKEAKRIADKHRWLAKYIADVAIEGQKYQRNRTRLLEDVAVDPELVTAAATISETDDAALLTMLTSDLEGYNKQRWLETVLDEVKAIAKDGTISQAPSAE